MQEDFRKLALSVIAMAKHDLEKKPEYSSEYQSAKKFLFPDNHEMKAWNDHWFTLAFFDPEGNFQKFKKVKM